MKDPAFLFYPNDYIGGTLGMTFEQKGAYIELLMTQFNRGHMTSHMIGQVLGQNGGQIWDIIKDKFKVDENGCFYNDRLEIEQNKRKSYTDSRKNNIDGKNQYSEKHKKHTKKIDHIDGHMTSHMEDENRNEIDNIIDNIKSLFNEKYFDKNKWVEILFALIDKHKYSTEQIIKAVTWARQDSFWSTNFLSLKKLLNKNKEGVLYIDLFIEKSNNYKNGTYQKSFTKRDEVYKLAAEAAADLQNRIRGS